MRISVHREAKRVVMRETDVALVMTKFADMVVIGATDEAEAVIESRESRAVFSENRFV